MTFAPSPPRRLRDIRPAQHSIDRDSGGDRAGLDFADFGGCLHGLDYVQLCSVGQCRNAAGKLRRVVQFRRMDELREAARDFFRRGLEKTGWSPYKWGKAAGVAPTSITRLLNNPEWKYLPKLDTLLRLARAAEMELPSNLKSAELVDFSPVERSIPVWGDVQAGAWRRIPDEPEVTERLDVSVPGYETASLFAVRVVGPSMDKFYPEGTYVICAPPAEVGLQEGDCVVVRRRDRAGKVETTLKQIERQKGRGGGFLLCPRSNDPAHQTPLPLPANRDAAAQEGVEIIGVVLVSYAKDRRGRGPLITL